METTESTKHKIRYVDCPRWVKRKMRRNLNLAAKTKVNKTRAKLAAQKLAALDKEAESQQKPANETGHAEASKPTQKVNQNRPSMIRKFVTGMNHKMRDTFRKFKFNFRSGIDNTTGRSFHNGRCRRLKNVSTG